MFGINKTLQIFIGFIVVFSLILSGAFIYQNFFDDNKDSDSVEVKFDKVAILEKVQSQSKLQTVTQRLERRIEVTIKRSDFEAFGVTLLSSSLTREFFIVGDVNAGIDLDKIDQDSIVIDQEAQTLQITLPAADIFSVEVSGDRSELLREEATLLFNVQSSFAGNRDELENELFKTVTTQSKQALANAACESEIQSIASQNAIETLKTLLANFEFQDIIIITTPAQDCQYDPALEVTTTLQ